MFMLFNCNYTEFGDEIANLIRTSLKHLVKDEVKRLVDQQTTIEKKMYSLKEVSYITGLSIHAIKGRYRRGNLDVVYEGQTPLIPADEVDRLIDKLERQKKR